MAQFSMEITRLTGSVLRGNQHLWLQSEPPRKTDQRNILAHLHRACILNFDVSGPATFERVNKSPVVRALSVDHQPTFCAIVPVLAPVRGEDTRKQPLFAVINPNEEFCAWISNQMRFDAKLLSAVVYLAIAQLLSSRSLYHIMIF